MSARPASSDYRCICFVRAQHLVESETIVPDPASFQKTETWLYRRAIMCCRRVDGIFAFDSGTSALFFGSWVRPARCDGWRCCDTFPPRCSKASMIFVSARLICATKRLTHGLNSTNTSTKREASPFRPSLSCFRHACLRIFFQCNPPKGRSHPALVIHLDRLTPREAVSGGQ